MLCVLGPGPHWGTEGVYAMLVSRRGGLCYAFWAQVPARVTVRFKASVTAGFKASVNAGVKARAEEGVYAMLVSRRGLKRGFMTCWCQGEGERGNLCYAGVKARAEAGAIG